ncbi:hypoxia induced protein conserved region-domain-containing protein [Cristinia sonorae]|uniref:Hypoxia induced protein conserved region-domain-containing protein n=1 Tax=Cristinia sonorae TaxID=1940300 RepID=A0A8K0URF8_9AGAR|nr:hypoxia induced protein conserved region-domain-containing protein [Cristinia sonorae]
MSIQNIGTTGVVLPPSAESPLQKFKRKFKQEPLVPIGAGLTTVALIMASIKLRKGDSRQLNHWLRARLIFQGFTIAAVAGGTYFYGRSRQQKEEQARKEEMEEEYEKVKERRAFEERLKAAEEAHAAETQAMASGSSASASGEDGSGSGIWSVLGLGRGKTKTSQGAGTSSTPAPHVQEASTPTTAVAEPTQSSNSRGSWWKFGWK